MVRQSIISNKLKTNNNGATQATSNGKNTI
uniref:Uncharacterized protein n=1 Tax=Rhizophora mucronata TaxID=61149 RepID=A0A2P2NW51_RHIMU